MLPEMHQLINNNVQQHHMNKFDESYVTNASPKNKEE
jgi:hypothetical protein